MRLRKDISEGAKIPRGYGVAYRDYHGDMLAHTYPFGLHLVVRWAVAAYWRVVHLRPTWRERTAAKLHQDAWNAGYDAGVRWRLSVERLKERPE